MSTLKKFFIYFVLLIGFLVLSMFLENGLVSSMYSKIEGNSLNSDNLSVEVSDARATSTNGYIDMKITNDSGEDIENGYAKVELLDEFGNVVSTEYATVKDLKAGAKKDLRVNYTGTRIAGYNVEIVPEIPEEPEKYHIFGMEIDPTNVFGTGIDLTGVKIFGKNIVDAIPFGKIKGYAKAGWGWGLSVARSVPIWAYIAASLIVLWYI